MRKPKTKTQTQRILDSNVLLRRNIPEFGIDLLWDGGCVLIDFHHANKIVVGEARGVRTATELMSQEEEKLHASCVGMEMDLL